MNQNRTYYPIRPAHRIASGYRTSVSARTWRSGNLRSYQALAPGGDVLSFAITTMHTLAHPPSVHCSLITSHWSHTFSAKERDAETGLSYFGARYYSSDLSIWLSVDPQAAKYPSLSPYVYCADNPVKLVDPNGEEISPIYDTHGNFLGTDDEGLTGKAIVMKKEKFKQGMSHKDALSNNLGSKGLVDDNARKKLSEHYSGLKERPDYDGYLTKAEADAWWKGKSGQPLYVDQRKIELPGITTQSFADNKDDSFYVNFLGSSSNTGKVYGTIKLTLVDANTGEVHIGGSNYMDKYDFKMDGRPFRDFATWAGRPGGKNDGKDFLIYSYGHATVPVVTPKKK